MGYFPFGFKPVEPTTWAYLSSLMMLALFFKFNRFWSVRNFDLVLIILLTPGLLMVHYGQLNQEELRKRGDSGAAVIQESEEQASLPSPAPLSSQELNEDESLVEAGDEETPVAVTKPLNDFQKLERSGYIWLFVVGGVFLFRLLYDPLLARKPMLEPNLSVGGLVFLTCSLAIFLFANVLVSNPANLAGPEGAVNIVRLNAQEAGDELQKYGPGYPLLHIVPSIRTFRAANDQENDIGELATRSELVEVARIMAIISQLSLIHI